MASSTHSLDSLSSPSPSPSPPPQQDLVPKPAKASITPTATAPPLRSLDTDSELSELTDDDQDPSAFADKRAPSAGTAGSSKTKAPVEPTSHDDDDHAPANNGPVSGSSSSSRPARRGTHQRSLSSRRGGVGRKKRSSIVPAPMWGWAESKASANAAPVEEEEEEMSGPPRAMEEEEEEEEEDEDDDEEGYPSNRAAGSAGIDEEEDSGREFVNQRRLGPYVNQRLPGIRTFYRRRGAGRGGAQSARRQGPASRKYDDDDDDVPVEGESKPEKRPRQAVSARRSQRQDEVPEPVVNDEVGAGSASGSDYGSSKKKRPTKSRAPASTSRKRKEGGGDESSSSELPTHTKKKKNGKAPRKDNKDEDVASDVSQIPAANAYSGDENTESEDDTQPPEPPAPISPLKSATSISKPLSSIANNASANSAAVALTALAAAADAIDQTEIPFREVASLSATITSPSIATGSPALPIAATASTSTSEEATPAVSRSRSSSPADSEGGQSRTKTQSKRGIPRSAPKRNAAVDGKTAKAMIPATVPVNLTKKGPPPPLDLKINTALDDLPKPIIETSNEEGMEVDATADEANNRSLDDRDIDMEGDEPEDDEDEEDGEDETSQHDEDEPVNADEEAVDPDEEAADGEDEPGDDDQEQDPEAVEAENENDEGPSPDGDLDDHEIELQPAHRAEALDVLATIELKFALLRERVYVEKMEGLAWEESMVQTAAHPELQHLQKELSKRRDKRLELASRKRSYEVANATKRRKADEDGIWSWWKLSVEEVQIDLISETNRKRRKLERERRAVERPQPIRRIPAPPPIDMPLPPPSLRKILKSYPFGTRKHNKSETHHYHHHHPMHPNSHHPKNFVYPEISSLSAVDVASDLEFLLQNRRAQPAYEMQLGPTPWSRTSSFTQLNGAGLGPGSGSGPSSMLGMGRPMNNGPLPPPPQNPSMMGPPPPGNMMQQHPGQHPLGYEQYGDVPQYGPGGPPPPSGRMRDHPPMSSYPHGPGGPPPLGTPGGHRESINAYPGFSGPGGRSQPSSHGLAYPMEHEMSTIGPSSGPGHQLPSPYFDQGNVAPRNSGNPYPPSSSVQIPGHGSSSMKNKGMNGRRSPSPHVLPNGTSSTSSKVNGNWMGMGMGMGAFHLGNGSTGKGDRDVRMSHEDEERERMMTERDRKLGGREREQDRDFERRQREKEHQDLERERAREHQHMQHLAQQHRQAPPPSGPSLPGLPHMHSGGVDRPPPTQGPGGDPHHHHHHRPPHHHHHVVHRHGPQHASSSLPPPGSLGSGGVPPIVHSPRSTREYEASRPPPSMHAGPHPTEVIMLSTSSKSSHPRDREPQGHWPSKNIEDSHHHSSSMPDYRDRDRDGVNRDRGDRDMRKPHSQRHPPMVPLDAEDERGDRPMATPFVMAPSHSMQQAPAGVSSTSHVNGTGIGSSTSSPRGAPSWNTPIPDDTSYRKASAPPPGYLGPSHDPHIRSPVQAHRYAPGGAPPVGRMQTSGSSTSLHRISSPPPPSNRLRPPQSPSYALSSSHRSPVTSPKMQPLSPAPNSSSKQLVSTGSGYTSSPRLSGPGRTATPTGPPLPNSLTPLNASTPDPTLKNGSISSYTVGSRTASPLMSSLHPPGSRVNGNGIGVGGGSNDRERERHAVLSPRLGMSSVPLPPPSKLSAAQPIDGH